MYRLAHRLDGIFGGALEGFKEGQGAFELANLRGSALHFLIAHLYERAHVRPLIVVSDSNQSAERNLAHAVSAYRLYSSAVEREGDFLFYPDIEPSSLFDYSPPDAEVLGERRAVEDALLFGGAGVVFTSLKALNRKLSPPSASKRARLKLSTGTEGSDGEPGSISIEWLIEELSRLGYEREGIVIEPGKFSVRGGLVDIFPIGEHSPFRIDFFGDEIDEITKFDPLSQRSFEEAEEVVVLPKRASPLDIEKAALAELRERLEGYLSEFGERLPSTAARLEEVVEEDIASIEEGLDSPRIGFYSPLLTGESTLLDYFPDGASILVHDPPVVESGNTTYVRFWEARFDEWRKGGLTFTRFSDYYETPDVNLKEHLLAHSRVEQGGIRVIFTSSFDRNYLDIPGEDLSLGTPSSSQFRLLDIARTLVGMGDDARHVFIASQFAERLSERLAEDEAPYAALEKAILPGGFSLPDRGHFITDVEILGEIEDTVYRKPAKYGKSAIKTLDEIKMGDYVVHVDYGVGRFASLSERGIGGVMRSFVEIEYEGKDKLYVPVDQLDRLRMYRYDGNAPKLNSLGRKAWQKTKRKIREDAVKFALGLVKLYKEREEVSGFSYSDREGWMGEFNAGFPYTLTPDQADAWEEVESDMASGRPMERLVCGDVGFGKTEIALRAAFLACLSDKQVLVMCPTTILADQHFHTFKRRFAPFPFRVEMLSRFLSAGEIKAIVKDTADGKVDVLIGTHRVLSKDVALHRLGLIVVDEEQRFGVRQKEMLKMRHPSVDVITLTATPIPRTLHMALVGMRDVSLVETAPVDRKPVRTSIGEYGEGLVRDAVLREMGRGGQVYFLHNRIADIDAFKKKLEVLVPEAKIVIAHGRMKEDKLEEIMNAFGMGAFDILLATTIIENGLDIPNVNTLIVEKAEFLGLAQMHQLRGRVGRSHVQAFAYFFHSPMQALTVEAKARLQSIYSYAYLGAGYRIAESDLRLRGAGNVFGREQHGLAASVGYDYYIELLSGTIETLRNTGVDPAEFDVDNLVEALDEEDSGCVIDVPIPAFIPEDYISDGVVRLDMLRSIARLSRGEVEEFEEGLVDRFGTPPIEVENLLAVIKIRNAAQSLGISAIEHLRYFDKYRLSFRGRPPAWVRKVTLLDGNAEVTSEGDLSYRIDEEDDVPGRLFGFLERLESIREREG